MSPVYALRSGQSFNYLCLKQIISLSSSFSSYGVEKDLWGNLREIFHSQVTVIQWMNNNGSELVLNSETLSNLNVISSRICIN